MLETKISRVKSFHFQRDDGNLVELPVPMHWNQDLVRCIRRTDYTVNVLIASKSPAEAAYGKVSIAGGPTAGYIIPGAAVLSPENPHNADANYCAYNLLIADAICRSAQNKKYELGSPNCQVANSRDQIFRQNVYYLVTWNKYFNEVSGVAREFALSLCHHGLIFSTADEHPSQLYLDYEGDGSTLRLKRTPALPGYVVKILSSLVPYCDNPFLRFFYLYQVIEYMMGVEFDSKISDVRQKFLENKRPSVVELREILEKFQDATREKSRIKVALVPTCPRTMLSVDALLQDLDALDMDASFAERIYLVRNILFHDYKQLHEREELISSVCHNLFSYLVGEKMLFVPR